MNPQSELSGDLKPTQKANVSPLFSPGENNIELSNNVPTSPQ